MSAGCNLTLAEPCQQTGSYRAWEMPGQRSQIIDLIWHSRVAHGLAEHHSLLPFSEPSMAIRRRFSQAGETESWDFVIFPAQHDGGKYCPKPGEEIFALRLAPERMEGQLGMRSQEYAAHARSLPRALEARLEGARRLADDGQFHGAWHAMAEAVFAQAQDAQFDRLSYAASLLRQAGGRLAPAELAALASISPRHLRRGFSERFGLSPRAMARRLRLTGALLDAERAAQPQWADIAAQHRFADQAHMIRECRAFVGDAPSAWHAGRRSMAVSFNT